MKPLITVSTSRSSKSRRGKEPRDVPATPPPREGHDGQEQGRKTSQRREQNEPCNQRYEGGLHGRIVAEL